ncbi:hypothetical protein ACFZBU_36605 [Embleya sp. NPDC008237]|uniref:hypothetical protein n=1 Tax=Embleya sp. NPDC008237 TaxID=3363978 RepID=UPI0036E0B695
MITQQRENDLSQISVFREFGRGAAMRSVKVIVDGRKVGKVKQMENCDVPVSPGRHTVRCEMDWIGSQSVTVDVEAGQSVSLVCRVRGLKKLSQLSTKNSDLIELQVSD